jgi:hypothetical protein
MRVQPALHRGGGVSRRGSAHHLVRLVEEQRGNAQTQFLRGLEVDDQLEPHGPHDRQIGRLDPLENADRVEAGLPIRVRDAAAIAHEAASGDEFPEIVDHWQRLARRQCNQLLTRARSQGSNPWQTQVMVLGVWRSSRIFLWTWSPIAALKRPAV